MPHDDGEEEMPREKKKKSKGKGKNPMPASRHRSGEDPGLAPLSVSTASARGSDPSLESEKKPKKKKKKNHESVDDEDTKGEKTKRKSNDGDGKKVKNTTKKSNDDDAPEKVLKRQKSAVYRGKLVKLDEFGNPIKKKKKRGASTDANADANGPADSKGAGADYIGDADGFNHAAPTYSRRVEALPESNSGWEQPPESAARTASAVSFDSNVKAGTTYRTSLAKSTNTPAVDLNDSSPDKQAAAINEAFDKLDLDNNGQLDRAELVSFMAAAAKKIRLEVDSDVIESAVDALLEDANTTAPVDYITREHFANIFRRNPEILRVFEDASVQASRRQIVMTRTMSKKDLKEVEEEDNQSREHRKAHWKNNRVNWIWLFVYVTANLLAFIYAGVKYSINEEAQAVFGNCVVVARGCAKCLNLNAFLILLPMCRRLVTQTRAIGKLRKLFPFDVILEFHMMVGASIGFFASAHVAAHVCDFNRFAAADEEDILALFGTKLGETIPPGKFDRWKLVLQSRAAITGIIMVISMVIAYSTIRGRRQRFNTFWFTHHLFLVMLIALCFHGTANLLEPFQSVYWVGVPLALYLSSRFYRQTKWAQCEVVDIAIKGGNVIGLRLAKPASWNKHVKSGMYAFINIPKVSALEFHPFTLTSAPHEDFIEFHFAGVGDWTKSTHALLKEVVNANIEEKSKDIPSMKELVVKVEGPVGAASQGFTDYPVLVLVGAGIGITPMISVLKQLVLEPGKLKRAFFYWTVRDRASFEWFAKLMDEIYESDHQHILQIRHFLTSVKDDDRDLGAVLLHHATRAKHKKTNFDLMLGGQGHHQVEVGRPNWAKELASVRADAKELGMKKCGIFLCGPQVMAADLDNHSFKLSVEDPDFHFYFTKETF
jgi:respiratory burst oxidase